MNFITAWDLSVLDYIAEHFKCGFLDVFMRIATLFGEGGIFWIAVAVIFLFIPKHRKTGLMMGAAMLLGLIVGNGIMKNLIGRIRPYDMPGVSIELLINKLSDFSFPSGHTLVCFEAATVLTVRKNKLAIPAIVIAVLVALSRLYLYVHYPTDVICGALLGIVFGICGTVIVNAIWNAALKKRQTDGAQKQ